MNHPTEIAEEPLLSLYEEALATPDEADVATLLGDGTARYAVIQPIGEGAWKRVSLAHDLMTGRDVAMCVPRHASTSEQTQRFIHEGRILARLEHAAILRLYDLGLDADGRPFFVTKYVDGVTMETIVRQLAKAKPRELAEWPLFRRLEVFNQVCSGVAYAHSRGVVHRDLKPDNVLIDQHGQTLICDWGLARLIDDDEAHEPLLMDDRLSSTEIRLSTLDGIVKGTPGYMAPEQAAADAKAISQRTDVYALGALLYTLLVFQPPISSRDIAEVRHRTIRGEFEAPEVLRPDLNVPPGIAAIAMKAMATDPADRYQTVDALMRDLAAFTAGFAPLAQAAGLTTRTLLFVKRHRTAVAATLIGLSLATGLVVQLRKTQERHAAKETQLNETLEASQIAARTAEEWLEIERRNRAAYGEDAAIFIVDRCVSAYKVGDFDTAFRQLDSALALSQTNERMWRIKTLLHMAKFEIDEAIAAGNHPTDPSLDHQINLPRAFRNRHQPEHYRELFTELLTKHDSEIWRASAILYPPTIADPAQRYAVRMFILKAINKNQTAWSPTFTPGPEGLAVDLRGHKNLKWIYPVLGEDVVELDLRGTAAVFDSYLTHATHVKRIIVTSDQARRAGKAGLQRLLVVLPYEPRPASP